MKKMYSLNQHLKNQLGFSLVGVLVAIGIFSIISVVIASIISNLTSGFKRVEIHQEIDLNYQDITSILANKTACTNTFAPAGNLTALPNVPNVRDDKSPPAGGNIAKVDGVNVSPGALFVNNQVQIQTMKVSSYDAPGGKIEFMVTYVVLNSAIKPNTFMKHSTITVVVNAGNVVTSCYSDAFSAYDTRYLMQNCTGGCSATNLRTGDLRINGNLSVLANPPNTTTGGHIITDNYYQTSDERLKSDIRVIPQALDKISRIEGVRFQWKGNHKNDWGVIAQDIEEVAPFLVNTNVSTGMKSVNYNGLVALGIQGVNELEMENRILKQKVNLLTNKQRMYQEYLCQEDSNKDFCNKEFDDE
jgi:hypothetical protein